MDWNNDGKHDWQDTAMDMYIMDQSNQSGNQSMPRSNNSSSALGWFLVILFGSVLLAILKVV